VGVSCAGGRLWVTQDFGAPLSGPPTSNPSPPPLPVARPDRGGPACP